ncbi:MAG TPA: polyprenyl synthetase family protein [bacterium]|jgi:octaprenyl-diphosphate synthase|nr:polyprenyl synthetase family protein [bacterium]
MPSLPASLNPRPLDLVQIYAPVQQDLDRTDGLFEEVLATDNEFVLDMVRYLGETQGKKVRAALCLLSYRACLAGAVQMDSASYRQSLVTAEAVELIHNATLVHDDVIDDSDTRRGRKTLNYRWGNEITVLMGDFIFARVFGLLARHVSPQVIQIISVATDRLCEGEIQEVRARFLVTQNQAEYYDIISKKTAALMAVACEAGGLLAGADEAVQSALRDYGANVGVAFQVADDLLDLTAPEAKLGKPNGHDIKEGKFTLPLLHSLKVCSREQRNEVQEVLLKHELAPHDVDFVMDFIRRHGGIAHAQKRAEELVEQAKARLAVLPESTAKASLLGLADYIIERDF